MGDSDPDAPVRVRTITDLAKLAGVSAGTVSRALAGQSLVNPATRERIEALAREHGFRPNQMASRLRTKRTATIGVVIPLGHAQRQHISDPFFMQILGQLADRITERGCDILLSRVIPQDADWLARICDSGMLDGVLLIGQSDQMSVIEAMADRYLPLVAWGHWQPGVRHCAVGVDNALGGRLAAMHLIARGARRLAFLGDVRGAEIDARYRGFCEASAERGVPVVLLPTHQAEADIEGDLLRHAGLLAGWFDGVLAASDMIAMCTLRALADRAIAVPGQVAVMGFDDIPIATQTVPRLTTIRQDVARGAELMVDALFRRIGGQNVAATVMAPELIVRDSA